MTDLMQVLYEYAKEELLPSYLPSPEYREVSRLTARLSLRLRDLLPDDDWNTVEKYEDAAAQLHSMELEAAFQARLLSGKGAALALPLLQQLPQLVRRTGPGTCCPARGCA